MSTEATSHILPHPVELSADEVGLDSGLTEIRQIAAIYQLEREREEERLREERLAAVGTLSIDPARLIAPFAEPPKERSSFLPAMALPALKAPSASSALIRPSAKLKLTMMAWVGALAMAVGGISVASYAKGDERMATLDASLHETVYEPERVAEPMAPKEAPLYVAVAEETPAPRVEEPVRLARTPSTQKIQHHAKAPDVTRSPRKKRGWIDEVVETDRKRICDEVLWLVEPNAPECEGMSFEREPEKKVEREEEARPHRLTRNEAMGAMRSIQGRVGACFSSHDFEGIATTHLTIGKEGKVTQVRVVDGSEAFQACVSRHVKSLEFPVLSQPFRLSYPFVFR